VSIWLVAVTVALLVGNGFFVGAEFVLTAARRSRIEQLANEGNTRARAALAAIKELPLMLAGAQLGVTIASLLLGYVSEPAIAHAIESALEDVAGVPPGVIHTVSFLIALGLVVFFHTIVGEMAPRNMAISDPERGALWLALPFRAFVTLFRPFIHLLNLLAAGVLRLMGIEPGDERGRAPTLDEIGLMISESARHGQLGASQHRLLFGAIVFGELDAATVMVPRTELTAMPVTATPRDIEARLLDTGHSRYPIYAQDLDHVIGFFHAKDLLRIGHNAYHQPLPPRLIRHMLVVPESRKLHPLLLDMRRQRNHFALVVDEHGGTAGIVTIEDVIEELVGEIRDEYDDSELGIERLNDRQFVVPGVLRLHEAADRLGLELPEGDYETVAGFLMDKLQRIPTRRDVIEHNGWRLRVRTMHRRRVVQVLVERLQAREEVPADTRL
jgi:CBS domain containing-hemolysin-like protein